MKTLTKTQMQIIDGMLQDDYDECGFYQNDREEVKALLKKYGNFEGVEDAAVDYYFEMSK